MRRWLIPASFLLYGLLGRNAHAQSAGLGVVAERFQPAATSGGYLITERPETAGPWRLGVGLFTSYARSPLFLVSGTNKTPLIDHMLSADVMASFGLWRFGEVGLSLPVSLYQAGAGVQTPAAVGDLKLHIKGRLFTSAHFGLGLLGTLAFPTGNSEGFAGTGQVSFAPRVLLEGRVRWFRAGLNAGVLLRQGGSAGDLPLSHELNYSAAVGVRPHKIVELIGELYGSTQLTSPWQQASQSPTEAGGAAAFRLWHFVLSGGASAGIVNGYGSPTYRVFASLRYQQPPKPEPVLISRDRQLATAVTTTVEVVQRRPPELAPPEPQQEPETTYVGSAEVAVTATELIPKDAIFFEVNSARIRPEFEQMLAAVAQVLKEHPELGVVRIEGHTDATGSPSYNSQLARRRAVAVREALVSRGVAPDRLELVAVGPKQPIADNRAPEGRTKNRRVVFYHAGADHQTAGRPGPM